MTSKQNKCAPTRTGTLLKERREELGFSKEYVANKVGFSAVFLFRVENGLCGLPAKRVENVAEVLRLHINILIAVINEDFSNSMRKKVLKNVS